MFLLLRLQMSVISKMLLWQSRATHVVPAHTGSGPRRWGSFQPPAVHTGSSAGWGKWRRTRRPVCAALWASSSPWLSSARCAACWTHTFVLRTRRWGKAAHTQHSAASYLWHKDSSSSVAKRTGIRWQRSTNPSCWCLEKILKIRWGCSGWCLQWSYISGIITESQLPVFMSNRVEVAHLSHRFECSIILSS